MNNETNLREMSMMLEWGNWIARYEQAQKQRAPLALDARCCPNQSCAAGPWNVQRLPDQETLWRVSSTTGEGSYLVASTLPACPFCGTDLPPVIERSEKRTVNGRFVER